MRQHAALERTIGYTLVASLLVWACAGPAASGSPTPATTAPVARLAPAASFVPTSLAALDSEHLVLGGATGDLTGDGVVARSADGGASWSYEGLREPALDWVAAAGRTAWATTLCPPPEALGCAGLVLASTDGGATWRVVAHGLYHPTIDDAGHVRALTPLSLYVPATLFLSRDGGASWSKTTAPCRPGALGTVEVEFVGAQAWAACVGDASLGQEVKEILYSADAGSSWQVLAPTHIGAGQSAIGLVSSWGQLLGISMLPDGHGWLWTDRELSGTADGGRTFTSLAFVEPNGDRYVVAATLLDDRRGFALVRDGPAAAMKVERTGDGGQSWQPIASWPLQAPLNTPPSGVSPTTATAPCAAAALAAQGGRQGESGIAHGDVAFTNVGDTPCRLSGASAALALLRADGTKLPVVFEPAPRSLAQPVVLSPGATQAAWLIVYWTNWCGTAPGPLRLRITLGDGQGTLIAPFDGPPDYNYVPRCDQPGQPSTLQTEMFAPGPSPGV